METHQLIAQLFAIASNHARTKEIRVDEMVSLLLDAEEEKFRPQHKAWTRSDHYWRDFKPQVLREKNAEQNFFGAFIREIFRKYEQVESFSWRQSQDYNDNWDYFDLHNLAINGHEIQYNAGFDDYENYKTYCIIEEGCNFYIPPEDLLTGLQAELSGQKSEEEIHDMAADLFRSFYEQPYEVFQVFLQSLHRAYHVNYFIDLFGWVSSVFIDENGIKLEGVLRKPPHPEY